jgi:LuxR family transcriptional regulator, maltose regulon positive regulatory protein
MALAAAQALPVTSVPRAHLVERLMAARDTPLVLLVAPAGYGKTTLLSEWSMRDRRPFVWVPLHDTDSGPAELLRSLAAALLPPRQQPTLTSVCSALARSEAGLVLVIDGAHALTARDSLDVVSALVEHSGPGTQIALATRTEPALGLGGLRAQQKLLELGPVDLAMTSSEAAVIARGHGFDLDRTQLESLMRRTEGWPAGLYLAALAAADAVHPDEELAELAGDDRFVADYLQEEILEPLPPAQVEFLARSSILDTLSGPLCDFVLERADSGRLLKALSRKNLMLLPLDRRDHEYRYHRMFGETLRAELRRAEPQTEVVLHRRASLWYGEHGDVARSIDHAVAAGDLQRAGDLLWAHAPGILGYEYGGHLSEWLCRFSHEQLASSAKLSLSAAADSLLSGDRELVEHWAGAALRRIDRDVPADERDALEGEILLICATVAEDRLDRLAERAEAACAWVPDDSPWRALGDLLQGVAYHLTGERGRARELLEHGARRAAPGSPSMQALCLAQLGLLAIEEQDWPAAESVVARARAQVDRSGFHGYPASALVYAVSAEVHAHVGRIEASKLALREATRLLEALTDFSPWYEAECQIAMARAAARLSDPREARALLGEAARQLQRVPDAEVALEWVEETRAQLSRSSASSSGAEWSLTTAELRILQFLPTCLSLREIAERLYVSANTVKTHARSVYRKLGASSRGEAVARARQAGLLDEAIHAGVAWPSDGGDDSLHH